MKQIMMKEVVDLLWFKVVFKNWFMYRVLQPIESESWRICEVCTECMPERCRLNRKAGEYVKCVHNSCQRGMCSDRSERPTPNKERAAKVTLTAG
jgi:hypothetical protein